MGRNKWATIEERIDNPIVMIFEEDIEEWANGALERVYSRLGSQGILDKVLDTMDWKERVTNVNNLLRVSQEAIKAEVDRIESKIRREGSSYVAIASGGFAGNRKGTFQIESVEDFVDDLFKIVLDRLLDIVLPQD
jgi:hypothetical protein